MDLSVAKHSSVLAYSYVHGYVTDIKSREARQGKASLFKYCSALYIEVAQCVLKQTQGAVQACSLYSASFTCENSNR